MFTTPRDDALQRDGARLSVWPAIAAASFAWLMALLRLLVGESRRESLNVDLVLALGALLLIPALVLLVSLDDRRAARARSARTERRGRHHLYLVSAMPRAKPELRQ